MPLTSVAANVTGPRETNVVQVETAENVRMERRTEKMENKVTAALNLMAKSQDNVVSVVLSDNVEQAVDSAVMENEDMVAAMVAIVVVHQDVTDKCLKETTPLESQKVNADHVAMAEIVPNVHVVADSVAVVDSEEHPVALEVHVVPAHLAVVIIPTLKTKKHETHQKK